MYGAELAVGQGDKRCGAVEPKLKPGKRHPRKEKESAQEKGGVARASGDVSRLGV